jgi:hypothetical protein
MRVQYVHPCSVRLRAPFSNQLSNQVLVTVQIYAELNLGCLHPVARVISCDMGFNPSTQL